MSAFIGPIHHWLYNKIKLQEMMTESLFETAAERGVPVDEMRAESVRLFGEPVGGDLEGEVDQGNIHGWLQERIGRAERRLAFVVTGLLERGALDGAQLDETFRALGHQAAVGAGEKIDGPPKMFNLLFDYLVEGMPCDRVNEMIQSDDNEVRWRTTTCLHQPYWDEVGGNVSWYYRVRDAWIQGFLEGAGDRMVYQRQESGEHVLRKVEGK